MYRVEGSYALFMDYDRYRNVPNKIREYRKAQGLTQTQLAHILGFKDKTWISHWESGNTLPNLVSAVRLSFFLNIPMNDLFDGLTERVKADSTASVLPLNGGVRGIQTHS